MRSPPTDEEIREAAERFLDKDEEYYQELGKLLLTSVE